MQNNLNKKVVLLQNGFVSATITSQSEKASESNLVTVLCNMVYFGYVPSKNLLEVLSSYSNEELISFWAEYDPIFKQVSFADRKMADFMVYKNFPTEVLNMSQGEYWFKQILIYLGLPVDFVRESKEERPELKDRKDLKVLSISNENTLNNIFNGLVSSKSRWNDGQKETAGFLFQELNVQSVNVSAYGFKENAILMAKTAFEKNISLEIKDATDVLRLAASLSDADISLRKNVAFRNFKRSERSRILSILNDCNNLEDDFAIRKEVWKKFLFKLHAGEYKFENVKTAMNKLYNNNLQSFNSTVENKISAKDSTVFDLLSARQGNFIRRFHKLYEVYGQEVIKELSKLVSKLDTIQLLKFKKYIATINDRQTLIYAPNGNWAKAKFNRKESNKPLKVENVSPMEDKLVLLQETFGKLKIEEPKEVVDNTVSYKVIIEQADIDTVVSAINVELASRLNTHFKSGIDLDEKLKDIKLPNNDQSLAIAYGSGSSFDIPENIKFIRTSSYWKVGTAKTCWFDNGWNFFKSNWEGQGTICWNQTHHKGAAFSGDPMSGADQFGRACQVIDLNIEELKSMGVRYCVWNILSFNNVPFNDVEEILGTLQFAEDSLAGSIFEPSRVQLSFQLKGANLTKYVAFIDLQERKLVYMDANFAGSIRSAGDNVKGLSEKMPAYIEYLNTLPSVYELFENANKGDFKILFTDENVDIKEESAYVFKRKNDSNEFENIDIQKYLK